VSGDIVRDRWVNIREGFWIFRGHRFVDDRVISDIFFDEVVILVRVIGRLSGVGLMIGLECVHMDCPGLGGVC